MKTTRWRAERGVGCTIRRIGPSSAYTARFLSHTHGHTVHPITHASILAIPILHLPGLFSQTLANGIARPQAKPPWSLACRPSVLRTERVVCQSDRVTPQSLLLSRLELLPAAATTLDCLPASTGLTQKPARRRLVCLACTTCSLTVSLLLTITHFYYCSLSHPSWRSPLQPCAAMPVGPVQA